MVEDGGLCSDVLGLHVDIHIQFMFNTNVVLDEQLVEAGLEAAGLKSRRALIDHALRELLRRESQEKILGLKGAVKWEGDLRSMRRQREFE